MVPRSTRLEQNTDAAQQDEEMTDVDLRSTRLDRNTNSERHGTTSPETTTPSLPENNYLDGKVTIVPEVSASSLQLLIPPHQTL